MDDEQIWMCRTCLESFIGVVPPSSRCPGCAGNGKPHTFEWYYAITQDGTPVWVENKHLAHGRLYL